MNDLMFITVFALTQPLLVRSKTKSWPKEVITKVFAWSEIFSSEEFVISLFLITTVDAIIV